MKPETDKIWDVIVIGGGSAGMMAAGRAGESGAKVLLLEKKDRLGSKLLISGKSRCNLTNAKELPSFLSMYGANGPFHKFLSSCLTLQNGTGKH